MLEVMIDGVLYVRAPEQPAKSKMDVEGAWRLYNQIDKSSVTYAMIDYSRWDFIDDPRFHQLRKAFVESHDQLQGYLKTQFATLLPEKDEIL